MLAAYFGQNVHGRTLLLLSPRILGRSTMKLRIGCGLMRALRLSVVVLLLVVFSGCTGTTYLSVRKAPKNPLADSLGLFSLSGPKPSARTEQLLRRYDLEKTQQEDPGLVLRKLQAEIAAEPTPEKMYAIAELAYIYGKKEHGRRNISVARNMYSAAVAHSYLYLFAPQFDLVRNPYDPQFRRACDLYNTSLEEVLRIINDQGKLHPGETYTLEAGSKRYDVRISLRGPWRDEDVEKFEFVSDYEVRGLVNQHRTYGIGVPLIAVRKKLPHVDPATQYYPTGMSFPVTAILRAVEKPCESADEQAVVACALELQDTLTSDVVRVANRLVPLETDLTTPLGYFLDNPEFRPSEIATWGLLNPGSANELRGLYMLEAFDPDKIPVLMVHGLWSSPETWTEMFNDLRSDPAIRNRYQFWSYLYPTGQPFWVSAAQMRNDLREVRDTIDPQRRSVALDQMVLVGHSMGGLVSRLQTVESDDRFWRIISDRPFEELQADEQTREKLANALFFRPNQSVRRVVTLGTPHRGSDFANDYTRWLGRRLIKLPSMMVNTTRRLLRDNPDFFKNTELLTTTTSIDSLAPDSPILPVLLSSRKPPWVKYHNVVGVVSKKNWLGKISEEGDGVVPLNSARVDDVISEIVVEADHVNVHQHPRAILEVRRILLDHSQEMYAEMQQRRATLPAGYHQPEVSGPSGFPPSSGPPSAVFPAPATSSFAPASSLPPQQPFEINTTGQPTAPHWPPVMPGPAMHGPEVPGPAMPGSAMHGPAMPGSLMIGDEDGTGGSRPMPANEIRIVQP